jgi:hypothetical protein
MRLGVALASAGALALVGARLAADEPASEPADDAIAHRFEVDATTRLFRRSSWDANGALLGGGIAAPLYHYALLRVDDVDTPWRKDSIDVELAAWGNLELGEVGDVGRLDGDVQVASARQRIGPSWVTLGRQVRAGGAARFVRFDGIAAGLRAPMGLGAEAYGGFTVLPRWSQRDGYHLLGSAADTLLRHPEALPEPERGDHWVAGGRLFAERPGLVVAGLSFHEETEAGALGHRNGGLDLEVRPADAVTLGAATIFDLDALAVSEARARADVYPVRWLTLGSVYQHLEPALLLSRQSVLSVFSTDAFDEWGLSAEVRPLRVFRVEGDGFLQRLDGGGLGGHGGARVRIVDHGPLLATASVGWGRVVEEENGYHALRASFAMHPVPVVLLAADGFVYLYDEPIEDVSTSVVGSLSAGVEPNDVTSVTLSGSLARSPWAEIDAQTLLRLGVRLEGGGR